eukprot:1143929-Pelagomonas_calceolata.AAC.3
MHAAGPGLRSLFFSLVQSCVWRLQVYKRSGQNEREASEQLASKLDGCMTVKADIAIYPYGFCVAGTVQQAEQPSCLAQGQVLL